MSVCVCACTHVDVYGVCVNMCVCMCMHALCECGVNMWVCVYMCVCQCVYICVSVCGGCLYMSGGMGVGVDVHVCRGM